MSFDRLSITAYLPSPAIDDLNEDDDNVLIAYQSRRTFQESATDLHSPSIRKVLIAYQSRRTFQVELHGPDGVEVFVLIAYQSRRTFQEVAQQRHRVWALLF